MPKAKVAWKDLDGSIYSNPIYQSIPVAILPTATKSQAAMICQVANMSHGQKVKIATDAVLAPAKYPRGSLTPTQRHAAIVVALSVLNALGLGGEATQ